MVLFSVVVSPVYHIIVWRQVKNPEKIKIIFGTVFAIGPYTPQNGGPARLLERKSFRYNNLQLGQLYLKQTTLSYKHYP
jgi:hypothetical protein